MNWVYKLVYCVIWPIITLRNLPLVVGKGNIPRETAIFCINHRCLIDPLVVMISAGVKHWIRFMAKDEAMKIPVVGKVLHWMGSFGIKRGAADISALRKALSVLKNGGKLAIFPQGTRVHEGLGDSLKTGAAMLALRTGAPVVPVYLEDPTRPFRRVKVIFGEAFHLTGLEELPRSEQYKAAAEEILCKMKALEATAKV